jgi:hypothetical protein
MDNFFFGYKNLEREIKERRRKEEISLYEYNEIMANLKVFHNERGERMIFRISKDRNNMTVVDYSMNEK